MPIFKFLIPILIPRVYAVATKYANKNAHY